MASGSLRRDVRLVAPLLTAEVDLGIAPAARRRFVAIAAIPGLEALQAGPGFHQRAVDREVLRRQQPLDLGLGQDGRQELGGDLAFEQTVAVLREHRVIPRRIIDPEPNEPAEQQSRTPAAPSTDVPSGSNRRPAAARRAAAFPVESTGGQAAHTAPQNHRSAPTARHWRSSRIARSGWSFGTRVSKST